MMLHSKRKIYSFGPFEFSVWKETPPYFKYTDIVWTLTISILNNQSISFNFNYMREAK